jgi:hypothetical protein
MDFNSDINDMYHGMFVTCSKDSTIALWDLYANKIRGNIVQKD